MMFKLEFLGQAQHQRLLTRIFLILGVLMVFTLANGVYSLVKWNHNAAVQLEEELQHKFTIARTVFHNEVESFHKLSHLSAEQRAKLTGLLEYDDARAINVLLQKLAANYEMDLLLFFDEDNNLVATSDVFGEKLDNRAYAFLFAQTHAQGGLQLFPPGLFKHSQGRGAVVPRSSVLCFAASVRLFYNIGDFAGHVLFFKALNGRRALARKIAELSGGEVLIYDTNRTPLVSSFEASAPAYPHAAMLVHDGVEYFSKTAPLHNRDGQILAELLFALDARPFMARKSEHLSSILRSLLPFLIAAVLPVVLFFILKVRIFDKVHQLSQALRAVSQDNLHERIALAKAHGKLDEITEMGANFNIMMDKLENSYHELEVLNRQLMDEIQEREKVEQTLREAQIELKHLNQGLHRENLRMAAEIEISRKLQQMVLPKAQELSEIEHLDIACFMEPAEEMGGDYYDILQAGGRVKIGIGDVTGHGLESGVLMLMVQMAVRTLLATGISEPRAFLRILNQAIFGNLKRMQSDKNLTLSLLDYHNDETIDGGELWLTGQHEEALVMRKDGTIERVDTIDLGFMVGVEQDITAHINCQSIRLQPGDGVVLYTDGITEARNKQRQQYGLERLCAMVSRHWQGSAREIQAAVVEDVYRHVGKQKIFDDITLLVIKQK